MKNTLKKMFLSALIIGATITNTFAQNWQYVGAKNINNSIGFGTYLYFVDLEVNSAGDVFIGYWNNAGTVNFAKYNGTSWTQLPTIGTFTANAIDVEVQGSNYYIAYSRIKSGNMYAFVQKYNGTSWAQVGDSLLLGNSGSGGYFDFLLDNNGVPTLLGAVNTPILGDKKMMQYNGSSWITIYTFTNSASTIFRENAGAYNSANSLYCSTQGFFTSPTTKYFTVINKVIGGVRTTVGDTIWRLLANHKVKVDGADLPYWCCNTIATPKILAYKLNGTIWNFIGDTTSVSVGNMLSADVTGNGKVVFNAQPTNLYKSIYYYSANTRSTMDTLNITGNSLLEVPDILIPSGTNDVYVVTKELTPTFTQDVSVMKHTSPGTNGINELGSLNESMVVFPNPSIGRFTLSKKTITDDVSVRVCNATGEIIYQTILANEQKIIDLSNQSKGVYFLIIQNKEKIYSKKIVVE